jgi:hypothetical protein
VCRAIPAQTLTAPGDSSPHLFVPAARMFVRRRRLAIVHLEIPGLKFHLKKIASLTHRFIGSLVFSF